MNKYVRARSFSEDESQEYIDEVITDEAMMGNIVAKIVNVGDRVIYYFVDDKEAEKEHFHEVG